MAEDWGDIFKNLQMSSNEQDILRGDYEREFVHKQILAEETDDIGEDNEDYIENMLKEEEKIAIAGLTNRLPLRTISLPWLLEARNTAIYNIVYIGGCFGVRKITVYTAMIYVDRFLSSKPILPIAKLLAMACLYLACEQFEEYECQISTSNYIGSIMSMKSNIITQFRWIVTFVTPIQFIKYFLSRFCRDLSRKMYAKSITVEIIMSTLGDVRLMSLRAFIVGAAATLLASNPNILTHEMIRDEINALPQKWLIPIDEVCSCYDRLLETNKHRLDILDCN
ncbi:cyclin-D5-1-like [Solanum stenotomum]|uniref:cyclin-D5-1-like n=1 Tax=Solanum stenotomum TaxID=172797 RepID=UPI0020D1CA7A|nr:cyclin-D5-1-like [Solanum stenotomum]